MNNKSCSSCEHRVGPMGRFAKCALSGYYIETERKLGVWCGSHFVGWAPRRGFFRRIRDFFLGVEESKNRYRRRR